MQINTLVPDVNPIPSHMSGLVYISRLPSVFKHACFSRYPNRRTLFSSTRCRTMVEELEDLPDISKVRRLLS